MNYWCRYLFFLAAIVIVVVAKLRVNTTAVIVSVDIVV